MFLAYLTYSNVHMHNAVTRMLTIVATSTTIVKKKVTLTGLTGFSLHTIRMGAHMRAVSNRVEQKPGQAGHKNSLFRYINS